MIERAPITRAADLGALDDAETLEGYRDGRAGEPEPGDNRSLSYWHGWRQGSADGRHREMDAADRALAKDVIESGWLRRQISPKRSGDGIDGSRSARKSPPPPLSR